MIRQSSNSRAELQSAQFLYPCEYQVLDFSRCHIYHSHAHCIDKSSWTSALPTPKFLPFEDTGSSPFPEHSTSIISTLARMGLSTRGKPRRSLRIEARSYLCRGTNNRWICGWSNRTPIQADPDTIARSRVDEICRIQARVTTFSESQHLQCEPRHKTPGNGISFCRGHEEPERTGCYSDPDSWRDVGPRSVGIDGNAGIECLEDVRCCLNRYKEISRFEVD